MTNLAAETSERFLRFSRQKMYALLVVVILLGATGLALILPPTGPTWRSIARACLIPVAIAIVVVVQMALRSRRFAPNSPEVKMALNDEWRQTNMNRATRAALIVILIAQYPLALLFGFVTDLPTPRPGFAMAFSTITLGLATQLALFLFFDRE
jgi:uncharacterized membrane protein